MFFKFGKLLLAIMIVVATVYVVQYIRKSMYEKAVINKIKPVLGTKFDMPAFIKRCQSNKEFVEPQTLLPSSYKLVYEMDFSCGQCFIDIQKIHALYNKLLSLQHVEFCLLTKVESKKYLKYNLDSIFTSYDIYIINKKVDHKKKLYLLDSFNKIVMAGDITRHPFLEEEYVNKFK